MPLPTTPPTSPDARSFCTTSDARITRRRSSPRRLTHWNGTSGHSPCWGGTFCPRRCDIFETMTTPNTDRVVGLGQATVEQIGVGPRSSESVVELQTFSIQAGGA